MKHLVIAAAATVVLLNAPAQAQTTLLFNSFGVHNGSLHQLIAVPFMKQVEAVTEGRVKMNLAPQNLAPPPEQMNMVKAGIADVAYMLTAFLQKSHPALQLVYLPGASLRPDTDAAALQTVFKKFIEPKNPINDVVHVGFFAGGHGGLYNIQKKPIQSLAEIKGKKSWVLPGLTAQSISRMGATVVPGPAVRMHDIVSKGVVDMFCCVDMEHINAVKINQYLGAITDIEGGLFGPKFTVFFNRAKWAQISKKDQDAIMQMAERDLPKFGADLDKVAQNFRSQFIAAGVVAAPATPAFTAELTKVWAPMFEEFYASTKKHGIDGKALYEAYKAESRRLAAGG